MKEPHPLPQGADRGAHQGSTAPGEGAAGGRHQALFRCHPCTRSLRQGFCADALIEGTTDPEILAELARGRLRSKIPALKEALEGSFSAHHAPMASRILAHIYYLDETIAELSSEIERVLDPLPQPT